MVQNKKERQRKKAQGVHPEDGAPFKSGALHMLYSIEELIPKLVNTACQVPDVAAGAEYLKRLAESAFMSKHGTEKIQIEADEARATYELEVGIQALDAARKAERETPEWVQSGKANQDRSDGSKEEIPISDWQYRHKVEGVVLVGLLMIAMTASFVTAYGNLIGTGLPVFLETPLLAAVMSMMAPMAGISVKLFNSYFRTEKGRRKFTLTLNSSTIVLVFVWISLFAEQFHGLSTSVVAGGLFDDPTFWDEIKDTLFVAITLLCEISIGAVIANRLDRIAITYAPDFWSRNPESETLQEHVKTLVKEVNVLNQKFGEASGQLAELEAAQKLSIEIALLVYDARRSRADQPDLL